MKLHFTKMYSLGSDFVVVDAITQGIYIGSEIITKWSARKKGIGFEQIIVLEPPYDPDLDFHCRVYSADGLETYFSMPSASCVLKFAIKSGLVNPNRSTIHASVLGGKLSLHVEQDGTVLVELPEPEFNPEKLFFKAKQQEKTYIIKAGEYNVLCGVVGVFESFCVVDADCLSENNFEVIGNALSDNERFLKSVRVVYSKVISRNEISYNVYGKDSNQNGLFSVCAVCAVGIIQGKLDNSVKVKINSESFDFKWDGLGFPMQLKASSSFIYDGEMEL